MADLMICLECRTSSATTAGMGQRLIDAGLRCTRMFNDEVYCGGELKVVSAYPPSAPWLEEPICRYEIVKGASGWFVRDKIYDTFHRGPAFKSRQLAEEWIKHKIITA